MGYRPAGAAVGDRPAAGEGIRHQLAHQLFDVPSVSSLMNERRNDIEALRARLDGTRGREYWRSLEALAGHARVQGIPAPRVPAERLRMARSGRPPRLPEADGRVARAGRRQRLHAPADRGARSVRPAARRTRPRQAALLRDGDADERRRHGPAGREPRRAGRRRSRATPIIRRAAAPRTCSRRRRSSVSTIPIARRR